MRAGSEKAEVRPAESGARARRGKQAVLSSLASVSLDWKQTGDLSDLWSAKTFWPQGGEQLAGGRGKRGERLLQQELTCPGRSGSSDGQKRRLIQQSQE